MRTASKDFGDLVADVMNEIPFERRKADPQIYKDTKSEAVIGVHVDDPNPGIITSADSSSVETHRGTHVVESTQRSDDT